MSKDNKKPNPKPIKPQPPKNTIEKAERPTINPKSDKE